MSHEINSWRLVRDSATIYSENESTWLAHVQLVMFLAILISHHRAWINPLR
ncbi:MAG: hypothetical protein ETSY1_12165 [Candidatus Entotheonella factor]|uniref:Uncharacterized protein n=1 Tax=Entotheonella factor TaxID=1429438 RepID=W4LR14_ENTF1|nr:MAG: hypothetical protein ETSY1_12165 [Candidatus Entotheonella factor]